MKLVQRGNKQLRVEDNCLEDMLRDGYVEVDEKSGKPVAAEPKRTGGKAKNLNVKLGD